MKEILSYYLRKNNNVIIETLQEHIDEAIKIVNKIEYSPILRYAKRISPNLKNFDKLINLAIVFHDAGKVFFQEDNIKNKEYLSFRGHEFFSSYIFKSFCKECKANFTFEENYGINDYELINFAILFHHHSMNIMERLNEISFKTQYKIQWIEKLYESLNPFLNEDYKVFLKSTIDNIKKDFKRENAIALIKGSIESELKNIWENIWYDRNKKKLSLIILTILIVSDNIAAQNKRGEAQAKNVFHMALEDFYNFYLVKPQCKI